MTLEITIRLLVALGLGLLIGTERVWAHKTAGMRTYALVSMGSALFVIISEILTQSYGVSSSFDPIRMASQIIVGVGFLGTGLIFTKNQKVQGLTTATGLWVAAGIGIATGFGLFELAFIATFLTLFVFVVLWFIEKQIKKTKYYQKNNIEKL